MLRNLNTKRVVFMLRRLNTKRIVFMLRNLNNQIGLKDITNLKKKSLQTLDIVVFEEQIIGCWLVCSEAELEEHLRQM